MEPKKLKRMIYIYEENVDFYDSLDNKSAFINDVLFKEQKRTRPYVDENIEFVKSRIAEMDKRAK